MEVHGESESGKSIIPFLSKSGAGKPGTQNICQRMRECLYKTN
jgi:hypothetical protein